MKNIFKRTPKRILIINIFGIGDVLFTTPLIKNLKYNYPNVEIDYICNRRVEEILRRNPNIREVYVYERDEFRDIANKSRYAYFQKIWCFLSSIRKNRYDVLFDFSLNTMIGFMTFLSGVKCRVGFNFKNRSKFLTYKVDLGGDAYSDKPMVEYYGDLSLDIGIRVEHNRMSVYINDDEVDIVDSFFSDHKLKECRVVGVFPGGCMSWGKDAELRRWGAVKYAKLSDNLIEKHGIKVILFGGKADESLCEEVCQLMKHQPIVLCGKTSLHEFAAFSRQCSVMVFNDSGPLHMAVAAGARTVSLFGPVDIKVYGPYPREGHEVIRKQTEGALNYRGFRLSGREDRNDLNKITVQDVLEKVENLL